VLAQAHYTKNKRAHFKEGSKMISLFTPELANIVHLRYKDIVKGEGISRAAFCAYISMPIFNIFAFSHLSEQASWIPSPSTLSRNVRRFNLSILEKMFSRSKNAFENQIKKSPDDWIFIIDNTDNPNRTDNLIDGGKWATSNKQIYEGRNYVFLIAFNKKSKESCIIDFECCKKINPEYKNDEDKAWGIALTLLEKIKSKLHLNTLTVVMDSWFDISKFHELLEKKGIKYVIDTKKSRNVFIEKDNGEIEKRKITDPIDRKKNGVKSGKYGVVSEDRSLKGMKFCVMEKNILIKRDVKLMKKEISMSQNSLIENINVNLKKYIKLNIVQVYNHSNENSPFAIYITNINDPIDIEIFCISRMRWNIEVIFKNLKQNFMFNKSQLKSNEGADFKVYFSAILYNTFLDIKIKQYGEYNLNIHEFLELERRKENNRIFKELINTKYTRQIMVIANKNSLSMQRKKLKVISSKKGAREGQNVA